MGSGGLGIDTIEEAWEALHPPFRRCLELAFEVLRYKGLPVGAVITNSDGELIAEGRNRVYDDPGGLDTLQQTPIAHAEMNALAQLSTDVDPSVLVLWSTHEPCSMCRAVAEFIGIESVRWLAPDPSEAPQAGITDDAIGEWEAVAIAFFLHNVVLVAGEESPILATNLIAEPEIAQLALELARERRLGTVPSSQLPEALHDSWSLIQSVVAARSRRLTESGAS